MDDQNKNLILATVLSCVVLVVWLYIFPPSSQVENFSNNDSSAENTLNSGSNQESISTPTIEISKEESRELALEKSERVQIETKRLSGSISLNGGRIDDLKLLDLSLIHI